MTTVISIENLWKEYRLGVIGHGRLRTDLQSWWARIRGKEDPNTKILPNNHRGPEKQIVGDRFWALQDISIDVEEGDVLGIIGRNGAGKSTLLKILSRVTAPTRGKIRVKGRIASLLEVGTGFHSELTGRENIFMNGAILGMSKIEVREKIDEIIDFSGVEKFIDTPVKRYSSGMHVRLAFAVAAHLEPEILVVDEVLAVGDSEFQKKCVAKMDDVSKGGRTVLVVSHNLATIKSLCTRCIEVKDGIIANEGNPGDVVRNYLHKISDEGCNASGFISREASVYNTGVIKFERIQIVDTAFENTNSIKYNADFTIRVNLISTKVLDDLIFHIYLTTEDGIKLSYASNLFNDVMIKLELGKNEVNITLNNYLQPGTYFLSLSASKIDGTTMDYVENIIKITVAKGEIKKAVKWPDIYRGLTVMKSNWKVTR